MTTLYRVTEDILTYADAPNFNKDLLAPPKQSDFPNGTLFKITSGERLTTISQRLENEGLTTSKELFRLLAKVTRTATKIQAGEYLISPSLSPENILYLFVSGKVNMHKLTIPEGLTIREISVLVEQAGFGKRGDFILQATDPSRIADMDPVFALPSRAPSLEGYLFPDTYLFPAHANIPEVINAMTNRFNAVFTQKWKRRSRALGLSPHEVVTLASIIEKETGAAPERPLISSVFHNRLKKGMRLQSDPTVIYGIPDFNGNITKKDLRRPTPYNTYTISGLPPGPIANPGKDALHAALYPEDSSYIYFVSKNDRTHYFSKNLNEHNRAVRKYQLKK